MIIEEVVVDHLAEIEEMIDVEAEALEGIVEIQTAGMIGEEEVVVARVTIATDLDTLQEIALTADEMIGVAAVVLEEIVEVVEVVVELVTIATEKGIWQETVLMVIEGIEEDDNFKACIKQEIGSKADLVTTYCQRNELNMYSLRGSISIGLFVTLIRQ